jgi:hypothetical protein
MSSATISNAGGHIVFKVEKWATPTLTGYSTTSGASGKFRSVGNAADVNSNFDEPNQYGTGWFATLSAASTAGNIQFQYVAEIEL